MPIDRRKFLLTCSSGAISALVLEKIEFANQLSSSLFTSSTEVKPSGELFFHPLRNTAFTDEHGRSYPRGLGSSGSIFIDAEKGRVTKVFRSEFLTAAGTVTSFSDEELALAYAKEKFAYEALTRIGSRNIPGDIRFNDAARTISMDYYGSDLRSALFDRSFGALSLGQMHQMEEMLEEYRIAGFFKGNFWGSNLSFNPISGRLVAFDFKQITMRTTEALKNEIKSLFYFRLIRNQKNLFRFDRAFSDFSPELIASLTLNTSNVVLIPS